MAESPKTCQSKDLRPLLGPPQEQGSTGWCFAHTTADQISARLKKPVAGVDIAGQYILNTPEDLQKITDPMMQDFLATYAGDPSSKPGIQNFVADWEYFRSQDVASYEPGEILGRKGLIDIGGAEQIAIITAQIQGFCARDNYPSLEDHSIDEILKQLRVDAAKKSTDPAFCNDANKINLKMLKKEAARVAAKVFRDWSASKCGRRIHPPTPLIPETTLGLKGARDLKTFAEQCDRGRKCRRRVRDKLFVKIDAVLDRDDVPSIGYASSDFTLPEDTDTDHSEAGSDHASVIAARQWNPEKKRCEYFLRNSFGAKDRCEDIYQAPFVNSCDSAQGGIWVGKEDFQSLYSVVNLK